MQKRLYRSLKNKKIAGVAAGLADYFNIDPTIVRVLFVIGVFLEGFGLIAYAILWAVTPQEPVEMAYGPFNMNSDPDKNTVRDEGINSSGDADETVNEEAKAEEMKDTQNARSYSYDPILPVKERKSGGSIIAGTILVIIGALFLLKYFVHSFSVMDFFPIIFIAIGAGLLISSFKKN